jgi:MtfA peptidase
MASAIGTLHHQYGSRGAACFVMLTGLVLERVKTWVMSKLARAQVRADSDPARRARLRAAPLPEGWEALVAQELRPFRRLTAAQQVRVLGDLKVFAGEKEFVGVDGFEIDDRVRVLISAAAALLVIGLDLGRLDHVIRVEVRARAVLSPDGTRHAGRYRHGMVGDVPLGIVELAWDHVVAGLQDEEGCNVVLHELAHALDHSDGRCDALTDHPRYPAWQDSLRDLRLRTRPVGRRQVTSVIADVEGAELFAVATELFFEHPSRLLRLDPELFEVLRDFYQVDPRTFAT